MPAGKEDTSPVHQPYAPPLAGGNAARAPWLAMAVHPRRTIRRVMADGSRWSAPLLAAAAGWTFLMSNAPLDPITDATDFIFFVAVLSPLGILAGLFFLYGMAPSLRWTGDLLGGFAETNDIRIAIGWSSSLLFWVLPLTVVQWVLLAVASSADPGLALGWMVLAIAIVKGLIELWCFVVFLHSLAEVQGFSIWKGLGSAALVSLFAVFPFVLMLTFLIGALLQMVEG